MSDENILNQAGTETERFLPHREAPTFPPKSKHVRLETHCATCGVTRLFTPGPHAVGDKFFWTCAGCGESSPFTDEEITRIQSGAETKILPVASKEAALKIRGETLTAKDSENLADLIWYMKGYLDASEKAYESTSFSREHVESLRKYRILHFALDNGDTPLVLTPEEVPK